MPKDSDLAANLKCQWLGPQNHCNPAMKAHIHSYSIGRQRHVLELWLSSTNPWCLDVVAEAHRAFLVGQAPAVWDLCHHAQPKSWILWPVVSTHRTNGKAEKTQTKKAKEHEKQKASKNAFSMNTSDCHHFSGNQCQQFHYRSLTPDCRSCVVPKASVLIKCRCQSL